MKMTVNEFWEALKEVSGANKDKAKIKTLIQIKKEDIAKAFKLLERNKKAQ